MIGGPTPKELTLLGNARMWESLISFAEMMEKPDPKPKPEAEYDWRVVIASREKK